MSKSTRERKMSAAQVGVYAQAVKEWMDSSPGQAEAAILYRHGHKSDAVVSVCIMKATGFSAQADVDAIRAEMKHKGWAI